MIKKPTALFAGVESMVLMVLLVGLVAFFGSMTPDFFTSINFRTIVSNLPVVAIMAIGMTFVLLSGGLDISVGSILGFTAINVVLFHKLGWPATAVVPASLVLGAMLVFGGTNEAKAATEDWLTWAYTKQICPLEEAARITVGLRTGDLQTKGCAHSRTRKRVSVLEVTSGPHVDYEGEEFFIVKVDVTHNGISDWYILVWIGRNGPARPGEDI